MAFKCTRDHADCNGRCNGIDRALDFTKVLGDENRLRIICILSNTKGYTVSDIRDGLELPQNLVSHHLTALYKLGIITRTKEGLKVYYKLNQSQIDAELENLKILLNTI